MPSTFFASLEKFESNLWGFHIQIPDAFSLPLLAASGRRVVCQLNNQTEIQCALMPDGKGQYFITINKKIRDSLRLKEGVNMEVKLWKDESVYGLPMPEELFETLQQDPEGNELFHGLSAGKQRTLLYIAGGVKSSQLRVDRALTILQHLKITGGVVVFKKLYEDLKNRF